MKILPQLGCAKVEGNTALAIWKLFTWDKSICLRGDSHPFSGGISYALVVTAVNKEAKMGEQDVLCCCLKAEG